MLSSGFRVDVFTVNIVRDKRGNGDRFGGSGGDNSHEKHDQDEDGTGITKQMGGNGGGNQTGTSFVGVDGEHQSGRSQTERSGERKRNCKPADSNFVQMGQIGIKT